MSLVEVRDLSVSYVLRDGAEVPAVRSVDLRVGAGERVGLVGESGSGKSTLALSLMGLLPPNAVAAGSIRFAGEELLARGDAGFRPYRWREVAMVFQGSMNALNPLQPIGAQVAEPLVAHGIMPPRRAAARAAALLAEVGIPPERSGAYPHELSGGMRQRAVIAMALSCEPRLLIADEPTTSLDVVVQAQILDLLAGLATGMGLGLLLVSHDLAIVGQLCHRALVMRAGEVVDAAGVDVLFGERRHGYTRALVDSVPSLEVPAARRRPAASAVSPPGCGAAAPALRLRHLRVTYRARRLRRAGAIEAVRDVSLTLLPGEIVALVGESGSGKTTTGMAALGLVPPAGGDIECFGIPLRQWRGRHRRELRRRAQVLFQDPYGSLDPLWTVARILEEPLAVHRIGEPGAARRERALGALERVGLLPAAGYLERYPHELSGGQRQRVAIAALLVAEPELIVADEPVSMVDSTLRLGILRLLSSLREDRIAILLITHDLPSCLQHADRLLIMHRGLIVEEGAPEDILHHAQHAYTKELIDAVPVRPGGARP